MNTKVIFFINLLVIIFALAFTLRSYLLIKYKWVGKDTFYHLIVAQTINNKKRIPEFIDNFIVPENYSYPPLFHIFLSKFSSNKHQILQYIGPLSDILTGIVIFLFCFVLFDIKVATLASALYLFTPLTIDGSFSLNPRGPANFCLTTSLLSLSFYYLTGLVTSIYISIIFSVFVLLTHRLTTQSLIFSMIGISIGLHSIVPICVLILSIFISIIVTKGYYIKVIKGHIDFIKIFGMKLIKKESRKEMENILPKPIYFLFNLPIFILFTITWFLPKPSEAECLYIIGMSLTILSIIWVFGEGVRHMSNAIFSFSILSALLITKICESLIIIVILTSFIFSIYKIMRIENKLDLGNITNTKMLDGFEYIKSHQEKNDILLCLPLDITYNAAYFTDCLMLQSSGGFAQGLSFNQKLKNQLEKGEINSLLKKYKVKWIFNMSESRISAGKEVYRKGEISIIDLSAE